MSTITDDFGVWNDLGTIQPVVGNWIALPETAVGGLDLLRFSFIYPSSADINSYILIRSIYKTGSNALFSKAIKAYPSQDTTILDIPIPKDLKDRDIYFRDIEIRKYIYGYKYLVPDYQWQVKVEELWG
jgi:hypothetical protein